MLRGLDGDAAAQRLLLTELSRRLRPFFARQLRSDVSAAEDLVQETLIAIHTRRESYDRSRPFMSWAFAIARYKMVDHFRRNRMWLAEPIETAEDLFTADDIAGADATYDLERLMTDLPERQRTVIRYVKIEGLSVVEAAERSGLSPANVKVSVHRGLKKLAEQARRVTRSEN